MWVKSLTNFLFRLIVCFLINFVSKRTENKREFCSVFVCIVISVAANSLGISLGYTMSLLTTFNNCHVIVAMVIILKIPRLLNWVTHTKLQSSWKLYFWCRCLLLIKLISNQCLWLTTGHYNIGWFKFYFLTQTTFYQTEQTAGFHWKHMIKCRYTNTKFSAT